ncbi:MAG: hypothetical protein AAGA48_34305 [Myxococcota bacterium]
MAAGFDEWFDAFALALFRDDGAAVGAFAEPTVLFEAKQTQVLATHADVAEHLAADRARLVERGVTRLEWGSIDVRGWGDDQIEVVVEWEAFGDSGLVATAERLYLLRGSLPDVVITAILKPD